MIKLAYKFPDSHKGVVIYHNTLSDEIKEYLLPNSWVNISVVDPEIVNFNITILILFIKNYLKIKRDIPFKRFVFLVYQYSTIKFLKPKIVLTFIDNSPIFHWLSANYKEAEFYAIQNGCRSKYELHYQYYYDFKNNLTNFFCFGDYECDKYHEYGHSAKRFIPVGSFHANIFKINSQEVQSTSYDFALVSQHKSSTFSGVNIKLKENLERIDRYLSRYLSENKGLTCIVLCRSEKSSPEGRMEEEYFRLIYGDRVELSFQNAASKSTYIGINKANVIIGCNSTAMIEAAGFKKKTLFCDYSEDGIWADYPDGIWIHTKKEYESFARHVDRVMLSKIDDYRKFYKYIIMGGRIHSTIECIKLEIYPRLGIKV